MVSKEAGTNIVAAQILHSADEVSLRRVLKPKDKELLEDSRLVSLTLAGDLAAYEILVRRYQKLVFNITHRLVSNQESAADLTQETFLKAFKALSTFKLEGKFKPWLLRIATNASINWLRDLKHCDSLEAVIEDSPYLEPAIEADLESQVEWNLSQELLVKALEEIPLRQRHVFILRYQFDLSYADIASVVGVPETTIKSLLFRARERLRQLLKVQMEIKVVDGERQ